MFIRHCFGVVTEETPPVAIRAIFEKLVADRIIRSGESLFVRHWRPSLAVVRDRANLCGDNFWEFIYEGEGDNGPTESEQFIRREAAREASRYDEERSVDFSRVVLETVEEHSEALAPDPQTYLGL
jgi:hypothetical protein